MLEFVPLTLRLTLLSFSCTVAQRFPGLLKLRASFDGGVAAGLAGAGWTIEGGFHNSWHTLFEQPLFLDKATSTTAEVAGLVDVIAFLGTLTGADCWDELKGMGRDRRASIMPPESRPRLSLLRLLG